MKKTISVLLMIALLMSFMAGCDNKTRDEETDKSSEDKENVETKDDEGKKEDEKEDEAALKPEPVKILSMSTWNAKATNILRDQLTKAGFEVELDTQPDYASFLVPLKAGDYDIAVTGWTTVTGNPDYAVRSLFKTGGDYNNQPVEDPKVDKLIDKAASETPEKYVETYTELENYLIGEKAYIAPLFSSMRLMAYNKELLKENVRHSKSRSLVWEGMEYKDESLNDTRPLVLSQHTSNLTSLWPIKANDGSINQLNTNMYIRLVNLTDEDEVVSDGSLSYNFAIAEGNSEYYFLLRDDVYFAAVDADESVYNTEVRVGADDVVFSLNNAKDKNSAPDHRTFTLHGHMKMIEPVVDIEALKSTMVSGLDISIFDALEDGAPAPIKELTDDKTMADNANGVYQVVKITTTEPFPQVLNFLAHQSAGITSVEQVSKINADMDVENYDPKTDIIYGDQSVVTEGDTYDNHLWLSGPYALVKKNEYEMIFVKNPGYMVGTEHEPKIKQITYRVIADNVAAVGAFRAGEIDLVPAVPEDQVPILEADDKYFVSKRTSNGVIYASFNLKPDNKFSNEKLRLAVLNAIDQDGFIAVYGGLKNKAYSTLSTLIDTGNELKIDLDKSKEYLKEYQSGN